jgi:hypothetical protein
MGAVGGDLAVLAQAMVQHVLGDLAVRHASLRVSKREQNARPALVGESLAGEGNSGGREKRYQELVANKLHCLLVGQDIPDAVARQQQELIVRLSSECRAASNARGARSGGCRPRRTPSGRGRAGRGGPCTGSRRATATRQGYHTHDPPPRCRLQPGLSEKKKGEKLGVRVCKNSRNKNTVENKRKMR